jgi:hypothetical protein
MNVVKNLFPNLLVITINAWSDKNSTGNTISNHFGGWDNARTSNIFLRDEEIDNNICSNYFRICESDIINTLFRGKYLGTKIKISKDNTIKSMLKKAKESKLKSFFIRIRPTTILLLREIFWKIGFRRKDKLDDFLYKNQPQIIHIHCPNLIYGHRVLHYCYKITKAKVVVFFGDEIYTYKNFWPLNFINQTILRYWIRKTINISDINYAATPELCSYYSKIFDKEFKVLYKGAVIKVPKPKVISKPIELVYAGNLLYGRWEVLALILQAIEKISDKQNHFHLSIFSGTSLSQKMNNSLNTKYSTVSGAKPFHEIEKILQNGEIVLHVESFKKRHIKITKYSFSTKIVDCVQSGSCIMGVGPSSVSSINFLKKSNSAIVSNSFDGICADLKNIVYDDNIIYNCSDKMYNFSKDIFNLHDIRNRLYKDLQFLLCQNLEKSNII